MVPQVKDAADDAPQTLILGCAAGRLYRYDKPPGGEWAQAGQLTLRSGLRIYDVLQVKDALALVCQIGRKNEQGQDEAVFDFVDIRTMEEAGHSPVVGVRESLKTRLL